MTSLRTVLALTAVVFALAACTMASRTKDMFTGSQDIAAARPFQGTARNDALLDDPLLRGGLVVSPIEGLPPADGAAAAEAVAAALRRLDVAAVVDSADAGPAVLLGRRMAGDRLEWTLRRDDGRMIARFDGAVAPLRPDDVAARVDRAIRMEQGGPTNVAAATPVAVRPVEGAPGDGRIALTVAIKAALQRLDRAANLRVIDAPEPFAPPPGAFWVECRGLALPLNESALGVRLEWILRDPSGAFVGRVVQENVVPADAFDEGWGASAFDAAIAAAEGLANLLVEAREAMNVSAGG